MKIKDDKQKPKNPKIFATFPLADACIKDPDSNATRPSEDDVIAAKNWVDTNEK